MTFVASFTLNIFPKHMLYMNTQDTKSWKVLKHELIPLSSLLKTGTLIPLRVRPYRRLLVLRAHQVLEYLVQNYLLLFKLHLHSHGSLLYFLIKKSLVAADVSVLIQGTSRVLLPFRAPVLLSYGSHGYGGQAQE